jgi:membrane dipeptidase
MGTKLKLVLAIAAVWALPRLLSRLIDQLLNRVKDKEIAVGETAVALHKQLFVADFHADSLLWRRGLRRSYRYGHTGIPRWQAGNVALQVIGVATQVPLGINFERNRAGLDLLLPLTMVQGWPRRTWTSPFQRALYQAERLHKLQAELPMTSY